jgi:hypothetical protein
MGLIRQTERAAVLPIQPEPEQTRVVYLRLFGRVITAVMRCWRPGDAQRCTLCPRCKAYGDGCLMIFSRRVTRAEAPLVSTRRCRKVEPVEITPARIVS